MATENIFLFIPNIIGFARVILAIIAFYFMPTNYVVASTCYILSSFLDAFDGHAARKYNQGTKFGAILDQLTDRCGTLGLCITLSLFYPKYIFLFILSSVIDISCHWIFLHAEALSVTRPLRSTYHIPRIDQLAPDAAVDEEAFNQPGRFEAFIAEELERLQAVIKNVDCHIDREISDVKRQLTSIESRIGRMEHVLDDFEQKHYLTCLIFYNVLEKRSERLADVMLWLLKNKGKCKIEREDIIESYRLGTTPYYGDTLDWRQRRPVVVRFESHRARQEVWSHYEDLRDETLFVYEFLTRRRKELLEATRKAFGAERVWTQDGNIFYWPQNGPKQMVTDLQHLAELIGNKESLLQGKSSHKFMDMSENRIMNKYYTSRQVLFFFCASYEAFHATLYLLYFTEGPTLFGKIGLYRLIVWVTAPATVLKTLISVLHGYVAAINISRIDVEEREAARKAQ